jgi:hypothetical protein
MTKFESAQYGLGLNRKTCCMEAVKYTHVTNTHLIGYVLTLASNGSLRPSKSKKRHHKDYTYVNHKEVVKFLKNQG